MKEITLNTGHKAKVSDEDHKYLNMYQWYCFDYPYRYLGSIQLSMHLEVAIRSGLNTNGVIDHKDRDKLNCCRDNLRSATRSQNNANRPMLSNNTSGYQGVHLLNGKYQARLGVRGRRIFLGTFESAKEAALAYNEASRKYFGEFAYQNEVPP